MTGSLVGTQWTDMPAAETPMWNREECATFLADLTDMTHVRLSGSITPGGSGPAAAGAQLAAQYHDGAAWQYLDGGIGPYINLNPEEDESSYVPIVTGAKTLRWCRIIGRNGNGSADPSVGPRAIFSHVSSVTTRYLAVAVRRSPAFTVWTNQPAALTERDSWDRLAVDMRFFNEFIVWGTVAVAGAATAKLLVRYSTNFTTASPTFATLGEISIAATGRINTAWAAIPAGALTNPVILSLFGQNGDGAADPQIGQVGLLLRST